MVVKRMLSSSSDSLVLSHDKKDAIDALKSVSRVTDSNSSQEETKDQRNTNLDRFFTPDDIDPCHFSFEDILWKPTASRFKWRRAAPKPNPLFQIVTPEGDMNCSSKRRSALSPPGCLGAHRATGLGQETVSLPPRPPIRRRTL